jgi:hypothetical protein
LELWTEAPGNARRSLGPDAPETDDMLPWPPLGIHRDDLRRVRFRDLLDRLWAALRDNQLIEGHAPQTMGRPRIYDAAHYERVAGVWLRAVKAGRRDPVKAVAETWNVSRSAANGWVYRARRAGWLEESARTPQPSGSSHKGRTAAPSAS